MGKSYVVKGVSFPRNYTPKVGDVVYLEGKRTSIKRVDPPKLDTPEYVWFTHAIDGTVAMSTANLLQAARLEVANG